MADPMVQIRKSAFSYLLSAGVMILLAFFTFRGTSDLLIDADDHIYFSSVSGVDQEITLLRPLGSFTQARPVSEWLFLGLHAVWGDDYSKYHWFLVCIHLGASLALIRLFQAMGLGIELSIVAGLLFLMNVAHFRAVHWIACFAYPLALILASVSIICFLRFLASSKPAWLASCLVLLILSVFSHASSSFVVPFCLYLCWRNQLNIKKTAAAILPLVGVVLLSGAVIYSVYTETTQVGLSTQPFNLMAGIKFLFWFLGMLTLTSIWFPPGLSYGMDLWIVGLGAIGSFSALLLCRRSRLPLFDGVIWSIVALLPFLLILVLAANHIALVRTEALSYYRSARSYTAKQQYELGLRQMEKAVSADTGILPEDALWRLPATSFLLGKPQIDLLNREKARKPDSPMNNMLLGVSAYFNEDPELRESGDRMVRQALLASRGDTFIRESASVAHFNLGTYYLKQKNYGDATILFRRAIEIRPDYRAALNNLGSALLSLGRAKEAIETFTTLLGHHPKDVRAQTNLGVILNRQGRLTEAMEHFRRAIKMSPGYSLPYKYLASGLGQTDRLDESIVVFKKFLRLSPQNWEGHLGLAQVYRLAGKTEAAIKSYRTVLRLNPENRLANAGLETILRSTP